MIRTKTIGVISAWSGLSTSIFESAKAKGYSVLFQVLEIDYAESDRDLLRENLDAYIFISPTPKLTHSAEQLYQLGKPVLIIMRESTIAPVMEIDTRLAMEEAVDTFVKLGHKDILLTYASQNEQGRQRRQGYLDGLEKNGIPIREELIIDCSTFGSSITTELISEWIPKNIPATAAIFSNRAQAVDCISVFKAHNIKSPDDIAVATIDQPVIGPEWIHDLSHWSLPVIEMGHRAIESITMQFKTPGVRPENIKLRCQHVVRESCGSKVQHAKRANLSHPLLQNSIHYTDPELDPKFLEIEIEIEHALKNTETIKTQLPQKLEQLEKLGMNPLEGFNLISRCHEVCLKSAKPNQVDQFEDAFQQIYTQHARWLSESYYRLQKEREGLTRENLFFPTDLSTSDGPTTLIDGLRQHLVARQSPKFAMQLQSWDKTHHTLFEWEDPKDSESEKCVRETTGSPITPNEYFSKEYERCDVGLFNLSEGESLDNWLMIWIPPNKFPAIREMSLQFASGIQALNLFSKEKYKRSELDTARKKAERARIESESARISAVKATRAKEQFIANMSHEIRTPMNGVIGLTDILLDSDLDDFQKERLTMVNGAASELMNTINNVLDFSKLEAGKLQLESIRFDLWEEIGSILLEYHQIAEKKGLQFFCRVDPQIVHKLRGDPIRLRQVLNNLLNNAIESSDIGYIYLNIVLVNKNGTSIELKFTLEGTKIAIGEEEIEERFHKPNTIATNTTASNSSGLELKISQRIAQQMGGDMWTQRTESFGDVFYFTACFKKETNQTYKDQASANPFLRDRNVLLLDEIEISRNIYRETFENLGAHLTTVESKTEAIEALKDQDLKDFDYCIYDKEQINQDDIPYINQLAEEAKMGGPVIMIISQRTPDRVYDALSKIPSVHCLTKPVFPQNFQEKILDLKNSPTTTPPDLSSKDIKPLKILLAEDNPVNIEVVRSLLNPRGHTLTLAPNGEQTIALYRLSEYDLILMDINMPGLNGYETTRSIRKLESISQQKTRILAMTAHNSYDIKDRCIDAGMDGFIFKPLQRDLFINTVENYGKADFDSETDRTNNNTPICKESILSHLNNDISFVETMHGALVRSINKHEETFKQAVIESNWNTVSELAHYFKSTLGSFGKNIGQHTAIELEKACHSGNQAEITRLSSDVISHLHELESTVVEIVEGGNQ